MGTPSSMPEARPRRLEDALFFRHEVPYFHFAPPWLTVRARGALDLLYIFDKYVLDPDRRELRFGTGAVAMEPQVFDLLVHLVRRREHVVSRDELIEQIWGGRIVSESALSTRITAVRSAIGDNGTEQRLIKTFPRKGVRFVGEVREECRASESAPPNGSESRAVEPVEVDRGREGLPARPTTDGHFGIVSQIIPEVIPPPRRFSAWRSTVAALAAIGVLCLAALGWSYLARSGPSQTNIETAAKLSRISETIQMTSREDYEAARALRQWAVDLDRHNAVALADLSFAIVTGVLNHWSDDAIADLRAADLALQNALSIEPDNMRVRGAQCQILRAMRQFEAAIKACGELARSFPEYAYPHKEIGYDRLMMGEPDEALAEFLEADRLAPDSTLRWSWRQGIGLAYLMRGEDQKAIEWLSRSALEAPNAGHPVAYLASAYALVGREQEAREALGHYLKLWPNTTLKTFGPTVGTAAFSSKMDRVLEGLRLAGLPE
jgi:DNA-binding winged helix-turn-helix (wHTH) protein/tetratricopeptide (TPR) repeat protein